MVNPKVTYRTLTIRSHPKLLHAVPIRTFTHTHRGVSVAMGLLA